MKRRRPLTANRARRAATFARAYESAERVAWVQRHHCMFGGCRRTPCDNAHIEIDGMGRKAGATLIVPLCRAHHAQIGTPRKGSPVHVALLACAAIIERQWQRYRAVAFGEFPQ